jgi:hypothetical protein
MHDLEKMPLEQDLMLMVASYNLLLMRAARGASGAPVQSLLLYLGQTTAPNLMRQHRFI